MRITLLWGSVLLLASACQQREWTTRQTFEDGCWHETDTLHTTWTNPASGSHQISTGLTLRQDYPYQNIWLNLILISPAGQVQDTLVGVTVLDPAGNWLVSRSLGGTYAVSLAPVSLNLTETGTYQVRLIQYMRDSSLCEVHEAGLLIQ